MEHQNVTDVSGVLDEQIRVATLNLFGTRADWDARRGIAQLGFAELKPDLVSLQEVIKTSDYDQSADVLGEAYHFLHHPIRLADGQGDSIASRWPIVAGHEIKVPMGDRTAGFLSSSLVAKIDIPQPIGRSIRERRLGE